MRLITRRRWLAGTTLGAVTLACPFALAQQAAWPTRAIRLVVPSSAGGGTDILARTVGDKMAERLGQPVVIENRPGANGIIGAETVARAQADGYTLLVSAGNAMSANVSLYKKLSYDPVRDFTPINMLIGSPLVLVVNPQLPVRSVAEFIEYARARPGQLNFGTGASHAQIAGHMLLSMAGIKATPVAYKGPVQAITDVAGGQIQFTFETPSGTKAQRDSGALRALAGTSAAPSPTLPGLPVMAQTLPGFEYNAWIGVFAPAGLAPDIRSRLESTIQAVLRLPEVQQRLSGFGFDVDARGGEALAATLREDIPRLRKVIQEAGLSTE